MPNGQSCNSIIGVLTAGQGANPMFVVATMANTGQSTKEQVT